LDIHDTQVSALDQLLPVHAQDRKKKETNGVKWRACIQWGRDYFRTPFMHSRREMAHPMPTKAFLKPNPDTAMLFVSFLIPRTKWQNKMKVWWRVYSSLVHGWRV